MLHHLLAALGLDEARGELCSEGLEELFALSVAVFSEVGLCFLEC